VRLKVTPLRVLVALVVALFVTVVVLQRIPTRTYILMPDVAHPVAPLVHIHGKPHPAGVGNLYFVDVREEKASQLDLLFPWLHPHSSYIPAKLLLPPGKTDKAFVHIELRQMAESQRDAAAVAEQRVSLHAIYPYGVLVQQVAVRTDAAKKLKPADVIVAINGRPTPTLPKLRAVMATVKPRATVTLRVLRKKVTRTVRLRTVGSRGHAFIGIAAALAAKIKLPTKVSIDAGDIGGPSAGLAFTLEVMQQLGADVTHGYKVAATGVINLDGTVSAIGGVEQKTWGVRDAGAQVFLVPVDQGNSKTAEKFAGPNLKIIPVTSIGQALHALAALPKLP